jgi:hypothetical protein
VGDLAAALPRAKADVLRKLLVLAVVALAVGVAGGWVLFERNDDEDAEAVSRWNTCHNFNAGFTISYPAGWYTDHPAPELACLYFDPRRFEVPRESDFSGTALEVVPGGTFREVVGVWTDEKFVRVLSRDDLELGGRRAVRIHAETISGAEFAPGTRTYLYIVERDLEREGEALLVRTTSTVGIDYAPWRRIVDEAARSLRLTPKVAPSVAGADVVPPQSGLPEAVAHKRHAIWKAAKRTDYAAVAELVDPKGFEYTFGGPVEDGPGEYWRRIDRTTKERPLPTLAAILELPYVHQPEHKLYVWPFAFTRQASTLSPEEKEQLAEAIGDDALKLYEQLGNYLGYRAGIDADGDWVFYVAGD